MRNRLIARLRAVAAVAAVAVLAVGCTPSDGPWNAKSIVGLVPDLAFDMTDDNGRAVTAKSYRGADVLLYFGYSHCPDECPTTLAKLAEAISAMRSDAAKPHVLFVTVDPQRDTEMQLHAYVRSFGPEFTGLRGTPQQLAALARRYRVTYALGTPDANGDYEVTHSDAVWVFDGAGRARLLIRPDDGVDAIRADLDRLAGGRATR